MNPNNIELLAPAGSYEGFEAALGAGADAVYVGGAMFGARAYAQNFNEEELLRAIDVAHIHGKKLYLTVNTLLKNRELKEELVFLSGTILQCRPGCSDRPGYGSIFPFEKRISETSPSCQHADDCNWSGRNEIPGQIRGRPGCSCKRTFPSGTFPYA